MTESALDAVPDPREAPPVRWGVVAPGGIGHTFTRAVQQHTRSEVVAVGSRSAERAAAFAAEHGIARSHGSYQELVADEEVEAVYVASPHSNHAEQALLAIEAGKHVLVEKAFTRNRAEAERVLSAAEERGVFAMEAMWTRHLPHVAVLKRLIAEGAVGDVVSVTAEHGQFFPFDPTHRLYAPELAGGALLDLGVYPLAFLLDVLGAPESVSATGVLTETGVDGLVTAVLGYPGRTQGVAHTTLWSRTPNTAAICGTAGRIEIERTYFVPTVFTVVPHEGDELRVDGRVEGGFQYQIAEAARRIAAGEQQSPRMSWQHSLDLMAVMDEIRRQVGVVFPNE
ncbi:gfo/Idh/MocA family oxidoreductase [Auraticoccus sp. F435]|uniref:Gfo/Idh/MocA family oxidoreductase n=1 Tax=Auraticoccus cholistanensis TaxID=2656650 RepID=A0A6A9UU44_9ACTN|nr:Gfo/Idh/MocA family oxidoreductase [Auraticoccus cholistanensis]MVA74727.1 gfo/Idh/MocA family oxidoreductase [Auraticoccus cholistanensis]